MKALLSLLVAFLAALPAFAGGQPLASALEQAVADLQEEDLDAARKVIEPALEHEPNHAVVQGAAGILRFYEQRYPEAVELLEKAEKGGETGAGRYLAMARAAREITRGYGRQEGEHFVVSYPRGKDEVLVPYVLETLEAERRALEKDLGYAPPGKVTIEILNDPRALSRLTTLTEEEIKTSGTIAICKFNKLMVVSPKALLTGYDWLDTAAHEYVHYVLTARTHDNAPVWLQEGVAKFEEGRWRGTTAAELTPYATALMRDALKKKKLITFEEMYPSMAKLPSQEAAALAFAEVATAVEYLQKQGGGPLMNRLLDRIAAGKGAEEAIGDALDEPFARFVEGWKRYMAARPMPEGGERALRQLRFSGDPKHGGSWSEWSEIPDENARGFAHLGELLRQRGKWDAARVEYAKAVERAGLKVAVLADKYALACMAAGRDAEAESALTEAARVNPGRAMLHLHLARIEVKRKQWAKAREELLLANRTDPFDPEIHAGLALALAAEKDESGASRERRFAQILSGRQESP